MTATLVLGHKGDATRSEYIRVLLEIALDHKENTEESTTQHRENTEEYKENTALIASQKEEIIHLRQENMRLLELLNQAQILQLQAQKMLAEPTKNKPIIKKWWMFWRALK